MNDPLIVCRCEEITEEEIRQAIGEGAHSLEELKRILRVGMGPCQGRSCGPLIIRLLCQELKQSAAHFDEWRKRPPLKPVSVKALIARGDDHESAEKG